MTANRTCPECQSLLPADAPAGLCPRCLLQRGLGSDTSGTTAGYGPFAAPSVAELAPLFPQLEIIELLGQGGMGAVYKARQPGLDRLVALKILPPAVDASFAERFTREARTLAKLNHPGIVTVFDFGQAGGLYYFVMEFVEGVNLRQAQQAHKLSPAEALAIVPKICESLQVAHDAGVVHRDIKPENILLDAKGRVKIADFGLAKLLDRPEQSHLTGTHQAMGTMHYMAPEQWEKPLTVDHRADIYSLGVVFYELLTGELPLGRFAPPSQKVQIDVRLDDIVLRTLEKEPDRRYQKASAVKQAVEKIAPPNVDDLAPEEIKAEMESLKQRRRQLANVFGKKLSEDFRKKVDANYRNMAPHKITILKIGGTLISLILWVLVFVENHNILLSKTALPMAVQVTVTAFLIVRGIEEARTRAQTGRGFPRSTSLVASLPMVLFNSVWLGWSLSVAVGDTTRVVGNGFCLALNCVLAGVDLLRWYAKRSTAVLQALGRPALEGRRAIEVDETPQPGFGSWVAVPFCLLTVATFMTLAVATPSIGYEASELMFYPVWIGLIVIGLALTIHWAYWRTGWKAPTMNNDSPSNDLANPVAPTPPTESSLLQRIGLPVFGLLILVAVLIGLGWFFYNEPSNLGYVLLALQLFAIFWFIEWMWGVMTRTVSHIRKAIPWTLTTCATLVCMLGVANAFAPWYVFATQHGEYWVSGINLNHNAAGVTLSSVFFALGLFLFATAQIPQARRWRIGLCTVAAIGLVIATVYGINRLRGEPQHLMTAELIRVLGFPASGAIQPVYYVHPSFGPYAVAVLAALLLIIAVVELRSYIGGNPLVDTAPSAIADKQPSASKQHHRPWWPFAALTAVALILGICYWSLKPTVAPYFDDESALAQQRLIGMWTWDDGRWKLEFHPDGTVKESHRHFVPNVKAGEIVDPEKPLVEREEGLTGRYRWIDRETIVVTYHGGRVRRLNAMEGPLKVAVTYKELTLTRGDGNEFRMKRSK